MNMDDTYLRRYIKNLSIKIKYRQSPNLLCLFRQTDVTSDLCEVNEATPSKSAYITPFISTDEAFESQRIRQLQARYRDTITRLSAYIEMRDPLGTGHAVMVARYAEAIAKALCWRREKIEELEIGAYLHDIGKICVTETILNKSEQLTLKELRQIRRHTRVGAGMIMKIDFLKPVVPYVLYHHERYDGRGYPFRLSGKDIPVEGRILAVADTFEALMNVRPYRKAMSSVLAIEEMKKLSGSQLDPDVAAIFTELLGKKEIIV